MSSKMSRARKKAHPRDRSEMFKNTIAAVLVVFVAWVPIPAASNRPVLWALTAVLIGLIGLVYFARVFFTGSSVKLSWIQVGIPLALLLVFLSYLVVQVLPLGGWLEHFGLAGPISGETISLAPGATTLMILKFAAYGLFGMLTVQICTDRGRATGVMYGLFYVTVAHAAYALLALTQLGDTILMLEKWAYEGSATGTFINRNSFATFLAFGIMVGLSLVLRKLDNVQLSKSGLSALPRDVDWPGVAILAACLLVQISALVATESRLGAVSAMVGGIAILFVYMSRQEDSQFAGLAKIVLAGLATAGAALTLYGGRLVERLGSVQDAADIRGELYAQVLSMISQRPLTGYGGGAFEITFPFFHQLPVSPDLVWDKAHSTYLGLWADMGLIFGTLPMIIVAFAAGRLWQIARYRNRDWSISLAGMAVIIVAAVHSIADFSLEIEANAICFVAIVAAGMAAPTRAELTRRANERHKRVSESKRSDILIKDTVGVVGGVQRD